jgi:hypothetical protein
MMDGQWMGDNDDNGSKLNLSVTRIEYIFYLAARPILIPDLAQFLIWSRSIPVYTCCLGFSSATNGGRYYGRYDGIDCLLLRHTTQLFY